MSVSRPVGLVSVVRDEVHDFAGWIAWHVAVGFDTIFVVDDLSTDGTDQVIQAAAKSFDVRYSKTTQDHESFYERQQREYRRMLKRLAGQFEWLCFLDADEYLLLKRDPDISTFLKRFPEAQGIALNWRLHGNNGHVLRPVLPAPMAYPKRSGTTSPVNRHVKSIVRPECVGNRWFNVHWFDVEPGLYVNAAGQKVRSSETPGIIAGLPDFETALIMHFQNRSMEHFIERARKRGDTFIDARTWDNEEWNREEDQEPPRIVVCMLQKLVVIQLQVNEVISAAISAHYLAKVKLTIQLALNGRDDDPVRLKTKQQMASNPVPPDYLTKTAEGDRSGYAGTSRAPVPTAGSSRETTRRLSSRSAITIWLVRTHCGTLVQLDQTTNAIVHGQVEAEALTPLFLVRSAASSLDALLVVPGDEKRPLRLIGARQAATLIHVHVMRVGHNSVTMKLVENSLFIAAEPPTQPEYPGKMIANRKQALEWETFNLESSSCVELDKRTCQTAESFFYLIESELTANRLCSWIQRTDPKYRSSLLQVVIRQMTKSELLRFRSEVADTVPAELLSGEFYG